MNKKGLLSAVLGVSMMFLPVVNVCTSFESTVVYAAENEFEVWNGELKKYNGKGGDVVIPSTVKTIGTGAFSGCDNITSVTLPNSVERIDEYAFEDCSLETIYISKSVNDVSYGVFNSCNKLKEITVDKDNKQFCSEDGIMYNKNKTKILYVPAMYKGVLRISKELDMEPYGFISAVRGVELKNGLEVEDGANYRLVDGDLYTKDMKTLILCPYSEKKTLVVPKGVTKLTEEAFDRLKDIESIVIPEGVTFIPYFAFNKCYNLKYLYLPQSVTGMGYMTIPFSWEVSDDNSMPHFVPTKLRIYYAGNLEKWGAILLDCESGIEYVGCSGIFYGAKVICNYRWFSDVSENSWYAKTVSYITNRGIMNGNADGSFAPLDSITRGQVAVMLWNLEGQPATTYVGAFKDVANGKYYTKAVEWCSKKGIVNGNANGTYQPGAPISRQDFAVILKNYAKFKKCDVAVTDKEAYKVCADAKLVSGYAVSTIQWAYNKGFIGSNNKLAPTDSIKRAEAASMLQRFLEEYKM